ncbi:hypothetical protein Tco_1282349 [Tanacetum coccineum]
MLWNDPKNLARAAQNRQNRQNSVVISRQEARSRVEATGEYTEDELNRLARGGKLCGHIPDVDRALPSQATSKPNMFKEFDSGGASGSGGCGDDEESGDDEDGDGDS